MQNLSKELLIKLKVIENLVQDYEAEDPVIKKYFEAVTIKFILLNLTSKDRIALYSILEINDLDKALMFINEKIPYLRKKLYLVIKEKIGENLK